MNEWWRPRKTRYLGKAIVDLTPAQHNDRWKSNQEERCSPNLPLIDSTIQYLLRVSNTGGAHPKFSLKQDAFLQSDGYVAHELCDLGEGILINDEPSLRMPNDQSFSAAGSLYTARIYDATQPFFIHLFELGTDDRNTTLPSEFEPVTPIHH